MKRFSFKLACLFILMFSMVSHAQADEDFPALTDNDIPSGKIIRASYFGGDALWGIIDGGADIYLEYGFDKLLLQEIEWKKVNFRVEFYRMADPRAAYGIYSVSHFKCSKRDTLSKYVCITPFQVQSALGRFYISIANDKGTKEAGELTTKLFEIVLSKNKEALFQIPDRFEKVDFVKSVKNLKVIKGALGFQNGFPSWFDKFESLNSYLVYLLPEDIGEKYSYYSLIKFNSEIDLKNFVSKNSALGKCKVFSEKELLYYESNDKADTKQKLFFE
ncbi:MAG: DUF6599 family protein [Melioribacteraceae bacterium]